MATWLQTKERRYMLEMAVIDYHSWWLVIISGSEWKGSARTELEMKIGLNLQ